jgi:hypothetical protein
MTPILQDISYLLRLPIVEEAVGAIDVPDTWRAELFSRFAEVMLPPDRQILMKAYLSRFHINVLHPSSVRYIIIPFFLGKIMFI